MGISKIFKSGLLKASGIYTVSSVINASIPFLLIPILTRKLLPEDYGIVSMVAILINIVTPFMGISAHGAIQRKYYETDEKHFAKYIGNAFFVLLGSAFIFLLIFFAFNRSISALTEIPDKWLYAVLVMAISQFFGLILLTVLQVKTKAFFYGIFQVSQSLVNFGLTLYLVFIIDGGWQGRVMGQLSALLMGAIFCVWFLRYKKWVIFKFDLEDIKDILRFSIPLIPHTLGGLLIVFTDRLLITNVVGIRETGVYSVAAQIGSVIGIVASSFNSAYVPWLYGKLSLDDFAVKVKIVKFVYVYFFVLLAISVGSIYFLPFVIKIFAGKAFEDAGAYTFWIVLGYAFNGMYYMVTAFVFYAKKTAVLAKITLVCSLINIPLCYILLRQFGTVGAAISMTIVFAMLFFFTWILSNKVFYMPWFSFKEKNII